MEDPRKRVHMSVFKCASVFGAVKGETLLKICPYLGIALQGIPACSEYLEMGGASRAMQREPPTACYPLQPPSPSLELMNGLNTINATFFFSPSLL